MARPTFQSEDDLTSWLSAKAPAIGDDAAFIPPLGATAVTVDSQREGVHFLPRTPAAVIARRLLAVNLSDLAACGARPHHALCTLAAPSTFDRKAFFNALLEACSHHNIELVGGDLSTAQQIECTLTAVGTRLPRGRFLTRTSAQPRHHLWLAGTLGEAALGLKVLKAGARLQGQQVALPSSIPAQLRAAARHCVERHLEPSPELSISQWLARRRALIAAIDISDGLARDLHRLARKSAIGLRLNQLEIESAAQLSNFRALCEHLSCDPLSLQLSGGEDYALAFTAPERLASQLHRLNHLHLRRIGTVTTEAGQVTLIGTEGEQSITPRGWDHLNKAAR